MQTISPWSVKTGTLGQSGVGRHTRAHGDVPAHTGVGAGTLVGTLVPWQRALQAINKGAVAAKRYEHLGQHGAWNQGAALPRKA
jgi:hypothetical protein